MQKAFIPREPRRKVLIRARMRAGHAFVDVCIRDISSRGMLIQGSSSPPRGAYVEIFRGRWSMVARVVWSKDRRFGVVTQDRMDVDAVVEQAANPGAQPAPGASAGSAAACPPAERRRAPRPDPRQNLEASRRRSAAMEFLFVIGCGAAAAVAVASAVHDRLAGTLDDVATNLQRHR